MKSSWFDRIRNWFIEMEKLSNVPDRMKMLWNFLRMKVLWLYFLLISASFVINFTIGQWNFTFLRINTLFSIETFFYYFIPFFATSLDLWFFLRLHWICHFFATSLDSWWKTKIAYSSRYTQNKVSLLFLELEIHSKFM